MQSMTRMERIDAALKGQEVDRVPISFWRHFYLQERDAGLLAEALLAFQREYGWDFMKVNPRASYHVEDWGNSYSYIDDPNNGPATSSYVVHSAGDWAKIEPLDVRNSEALRQQLVLLGLIKEGLQGENVYFLHTIFSPLSVAYYLAGKSNERLKEAMKNEAKELKGALEAITETFIAYARASLDAGASGIFFATTKMSSADMMTEKQYEEFGVPYDLRVLEAVQDRPGFNLLHICADNIFFDRLMRYPVDAISWDATLPGNPSLGKGKRRSGKMVVGGISQTRTLVDGTPEQVAGEVERGIEETGGRGYAAAPGCTYSPATAREMLHAAIAAVERAGSR
jgi:uroporphyrinogen decarboxylase